jgi:DNA-binding NtrC family response regulator
MSAGRFTEGRPETGVDATRVDGTPVDGSPSAFATPLVVCASEAMAAVLRRAAQAGASDARILITGESGVGKDLVARTIHQHSARRDGPFIAVNCASFTESLLESELFGHVRGSFTDAHRDRAGQLQAAHRGTLFLDEAGEMSLRMQALLLRVLENGEVQPVGGDGPPIRVDARVVAATNRDLDELVASRLFREDLLYRLRVVHLHVPPLRDRIEDVAPLVAHVLAGAGRPATFSDEALHLLQAYRWPGNVRELHNVIEQTVALTTGPVMGVEDLPAHVRAPGARPTGRERRRQTADDLFEALVEGGYSFWEHVHPLFLSRDLTRHDVRELVRRGLARTRGNYRALLTLFGLPQDDYKKFLNFLAAHDCSVDYRPFRSTAGEATPAARAPRVVLPETPTPTPPRRAPGRSGLP